MTRFRAITANLILRTALHIGVGEGTETVDALVRRDGQGRLIIPGTTLAGALRNIATRLSARMGGRVCHALRGNRVPDQACNCLTCQLFGDINPQEAINGGVASQLTIYDAVSVNSVETQIRDGVGIDRMSGAAARQERLKYDLEVVPTGSEFALRIEMMDRLKNTDCERLLAAALAEWEAGRGVLGGRVGRGLGAFDLKNVQLIESDLNDLDVLLAFLRDGPPWRTASADPLWLQRATKEARELIVPTWGNKERSVAHSWVMAEFDLMAKGPFLINDPVQAARSGFDHAPVLETYEKRASPILPGSSLRGVLRAHAERIARTVTTIHSWDVSSDHNVRMGHFVLHCPACNPLTTEINDPVASCGSFIKRYYYEPSGQSAGQGETNATRIEDNLCLACKLFGSTWNGSRLRVEDARLKPGTKAEYKVLDFVAIDRFTGGGREAAKFDAVVLWRPQFRVRLFLENPLPWELGWLALTFRDLMEGLVTLGIGAAKGFGECELSHPRLTFGVLGDADFPLPLEAADKDDEISRAIEAGQRLLQAKGEPSGVYQTVAFIGDFGDEWLTLADGWVRAFHEAIAGFRREDFVLNEDSYYCRKAGCWIPDLYPARVS